MLLSPDLDHGRLGGAWWPRSRDLETELADLVDHLRSGLGRVIRAVCSRSDWVREPLAVEAGSGTVTVGWLPQDDAHLLILTFPTRNLTLLVVPPGYTEARATGVMGRATSPGNQSSARELLSASEATQHEPGGDTHRWDDEGDSWWHPHPVAPSYRSRAPREARKSGRGRTTVTTAAVEFQQDGQGYLGRSEGGREWRINAVLTGWRLEFRDAGDVHATNAGVHHSVAAAMAEACR